VVKSLAEAISLSFEIAAITLLSIFSAVSVTLALINLGRRKPVERVYTEFKRALTRSILISLELLVVADLVATVAIDLNVSAVMALGLLIVIRTILSLSLEVEIDGTWPWKRKQNVRSVSDGAGSSGEAPQ
jgi:uncharacterized membrane protein